jgi:Domain of unknown function (DUF4258)
MILLAHREGVCVGQADWARLVRLIYTLHARTRMARHGVSEDDVAAVIAHPYRTERSRRSGNTVYFGHANGQDVAVVVARGSHPPRIVTVWLA